MYNSSRRPKVGKKAFSLTPEEGALRKLARTVPFILPFKIVNMSTNRGTYKCKVVDASGTRVFGVDTGRLGLETLEQMIQSHNGGK